MHNSSFRCFCFKANRGRSNTHRWIDEEARNSRSSLDDLLKSSCLKFTEVVTSTIHFSLKEKSSPPCGNRRSCIRQQHDTAYAICSERLFSLMCACKRAWTRTPIIPPIPSIDAYVALCTNGT